MRRRYLGWAFSLIVIGAVFVTAHCANVSSAPESLGNINKALSPPEVGTTPAPSLGIVPRSSQGGCEATNAINRLRSALANTRLLLCLTSAAEDAGIVGRAGAGYNYYSYTPPVPGAETYRFRYGTEQSSLHLNGCRNQTRFMELVETTQGGNHVITATQEWTWAPTSQPVISQTVVTADNDFNFLSAISSTSGYGVSGTIGIAKDLPSRIYENFTARGVSVQLYAAFDGNQGSSWLAQSGAIETWRNDASIACQTPGAYYQAARAHNPAGLTSPVSAQYQNRWDCEVPAEAGLATIRIEDATARARIQLCMNQYGNYGMRQELACAAIPPCS